MLSKYASAVTSGTFMTFALIYVMQFLIGMQPGAITDIDDRWRLVWAPKIQPAPPPPPEPKPIDRKKLTDVLTAPRPTTAFGTGPGIGIGVSTQPPVNEHVDFTLLQAIDGPLVAMLRVSPIYPASLRARGVEGHVVVQFDVMADGRVTNISVIESSHSGFEKAAVKAAGRFKFKPRVVDGVPLASPGIQNLFRFEMDDESR